MIIGDLCLDPVGACDVQTALVEVLEQVDFQMDPAPIITADKRSPEDSGRYIVVKVSNPAAPISHGSKNLFPVQVTIVAVAMELKLGRDDAVNMINLAEKAVRCEGVTQNEAFCLLQGLPQVTKIKDGSFMGSVNMPGRIVRYKDPNRR